MNTAMEQLHSLRSRSGHRVTDGLSDDVIAQFLTLDPNLSRAIVEAVEARDRLDDTHGASFGLGERELITSLQEGYLNFYAPATLNPYVPLAARGPWLVTTHGAVLHDSGGYGMLGFGHAPDSVLQAMSKPHVMANIMTASFSQRTLMDGLRAEVGHTRNTGCPFDHFLCLNSGSESVTLALRIADINAAKQTASQGAKPNHAIKLVALRGAFHGRTDRPAQASNSTMPKYKGHLASFRDRDNLVVVAPDDIRALEQAFADAARDGVFLEAVLMEPVMGEGNPGHAASRAFYDAVRRLTREHGSMMIVDSVQAGLRAQGTLSVVDYPGFEDAEPPDMETYSKALNGGQYPLSVLAMTTRASALYVKGLYGNTMTTNPRALDVAVAALDLLTPEVRANIRERGVELVDKLKNLQRELPNAILGVSGTGLLCAAELEPIQLPVVGFEGMEMWCRHHGLGIIHGGKNAVRLTPHFRITSAEIDLMVNTIREGILALWPKAGGDSAPGA
jgi:acetylornithine/succinyldiaminopimelate/putrescine aminotransferase